MSDLKAWLDQHIIPVLRGGQTGNGPGVPKANFIFELHRGEPPVELIVFALAENGDEWPALVKRLLEDHGFQFDYLREQAVVQVNGQTVALFGGDGAPFFNKSGRALARLHKEIAGVKVILEVAGQYKDHTAAAYGVKLFFAAFDGKSPFEVLADYRPAFGA